MGYDLLLKKSDVKKNAYHKKTALHEIQDGCP